MGEWVSHAVRLQSLLITLAEVSHRERHSGSKSCMVVHWEPQGTVAFWSIGVALGYLQHLSPNQTEVKIQARAAIEVMVSS